MKKTTLTLFATCFTLFTFALGTDHPKMIELGKTYKDFMFRNEASKAVLKELNAAVPDNLKTATAFITQTITTHNKLLTKAFLSRPDDDVLKQVYIIRSISHNFREENPVDNNTLIDSLSTAPIPVYELVDNYYDMLFASVGNKNQPFDLSKADLRLKDYQLKDDTEQGIVVLKAMSFCGTTIWGYMNIVKPANTQKAFEHIQKFPRINGLPYYQYTDFYFADFSMVIIKNKGVQSYKGYYLDKFYETLLAHLICLNKEGGSEKEQRDLLLGSILKNQNLYKYTKYKETLEKIFQEQQRD